MAFPVKPLVEYEDITIAASGSLSAEVDLGNRVLFGIQMPTGWTAASITFSAALASGGTFQDVYDGGGTEVAKTVAASRFVALDPLLFHGIRFIKIRSGTSATPVNQATERTISLVLGDRKIG